MAGRNWLVRRIWGLAVGMVVTASVTAAHLGGVFDRFSLAALDLAFRNLTRIDADETIVMIDINDPAIERIGRWPWPRRQYANLINALHEAGAKIIAMDVVFAEPMRPRFDHPALSAHYDVDPPQSVLGEITLDDAIRDDDELKQAIRRAGNVYLAMFSKLAKPDRSIEQIEAAARELFGQNPDADLHAFVQRMPVDLSSTAEDQYHHRRMMFFLTQDFSLGVDELSRRLDLPGERIERYLAGAKRTAARQLAADYLAHHPDASFARVFEHVLPGRSLENRTPDREDLLRGYRTARAMRFAIDNYPAVPPRVRERIPHGWDLTVPLDKLASAGKAVAFVTFEPDRVDGVLRHIPIVIDVRGRLVPHLGFAVACDLLDIDAASIAYSDSGFLSLLDRSGQRHWRVPLNAFGKSLINWHIDRKDPRWQNSFVHIPATRVMEVPLNRRAMRQNERLLGLTMARAVALRFGEDHAGYAEYAALVRRRSDADKNNTPLDESIRTAIEVIEKQTLDWLAFMNQSIQGVEPQDEDEASRFALYRDLHDKLVAGLLSDEVKRKNERLQVRNAALQVELRRRIEDKVCFVGYTASAIADTVNSPVFKNMPGVLGHANLLNTFVQNQFPRMSSRTIGAAIIVLSGLLITLLTSSRGPWVSLIGVVLLMAGVLLPGWALLRFCDYYVTGITGSLFGVFITWAFITLYRQVVEQRQRRQIARSLARQTSPAIAAQIARGATEADFAPRPADVTCYFSDLQGFTALAEAIGPERTKEVLNRYLGAMSEVLLKYQGSSKFMGDGIFAYFNSPIWPCPDHAVAGCEAALDCSDTLAALKRAEAGGAFAREFDSLVMRVGIHTGPVFAGSYGSGDRAEYTCIGDTVNLAARLEPANKVFGTRTLVSESCRNKVDDRYEFRCLGKVQVKGKTQAVMVYELLGRPGDVGNDQLKYAEAFAEAILRFGQRRWDDALRAFDRCARLRDNDPAIHLYDAEIERFRDDPPPPDWNGAIELVTK